MVGRALRHTAEKDHKRELGDDAKLEYQIVMDNGQSTRSGNGGTVSFPNYREGSNYNNEMSLPGMLSSPMVKNPFVIPGLKKINVDSQLNPNYNFDSFIEGDCNRLARSAGYAVAKAPGLRLSTLLLFMVG